MTSSSRPHLGGLFNGSEPPTRPGRVNDVAGPKLVSAPVTARRSETTDKPTPEPTDAGPQHGRALPEWVDPIKAIEQYFAFLQTLLEVNRDVAVACTRAVLSLPQRVGIRH